MNHAGIPLPIVIEKDGPTEKAYDLYSRLLKDRIVFVGTPIEDNIANSVIGQLLFLEADNPSADIHMYVNSPGGVVSSGMGIYDTMRYVKPDIVTICVGQAVSMGCFLLAGGTKGKRFSLPNARMMMHQIQGGQQGSMPDMKIQLAEAERVNKVLFEITAENTGKTYEEVIAEFDRDRYMSPLEAIKFGIIDGIKESSVRETNE